MKAVVQRVTQAEVRVANQVIGRVGNGLLVLLGVANTDTEAEAKLLASKVCTLRIFGDEAGKMNLSIQDTGGAMLVVSQFTLLADVQRGRRPSFIDAAPPEEANRLYRHFVSLVEAHGIATATGEFGAHMQVSLVNDGPVTLLLDTDTWMLRSAPARESTSE